MISEQKCGFRLKKSTTDVMLFVTVLMEKKELHYGRQRDIAG